MTVPGYTDISHFRAPYKNSYLYTGVGGFGQSVATTAMAQSTQTIDGVIHWNPEVADVIITGLKGYSAVHLSNRAVQLVPLTPEQAAALAARQPLAEQMSAQTWLDRKLKEGNVVFATPSVIFPVGGGPPQQLAAVPKDDKETIRMTSHIAPVLQTPSMLAGLMTPVALAAVALVGGVAAWAIWAGFKKRG